MRKRWRRSLFMISVNWVRFQQSWLAVCRLDAIFLVEITDNLREKGVQYIIMWTANFTRGGTWTEVFERLICSSSSSLVSGSRPKLVSFAAVNILFSVIAFLRNSLILVALHKESSLHRPSNLLYLCLAATDLLVGLVTQPLNATFAISLVHEH